MNKAFKIIWLIVSFVLLFPFIVAIETIALLFSMYTAAKLDYTIEWAFKNWFDLIKRGIEMNVEFVKNGL